MNKVLKIAIATVIIGVVGNLAVYVYNKYERYSVMKLYQSLKENTKVYVYDTVYYSTINQILYVENPSERSKLQGYYDSLENYEISVRKGISKKRMEILPSGDTGYLDPIPIPVEVNYFSPYSSLFLIGYSGKDSLFAEVTYLDTLWSKVETGWVYGKFIHLLPPPPKPEPKYIIEYNGKAYKFDNDTDYKKFLDTLKIKKTGKIE